MSSLRILVGIFFILLLSIPTSAEDKKKEKLRTDCNATDEFIEAMEFLRSHEVFSLNKAMKQKIAFRISLGCTGAAKRFRESITFLEKYKVYGAPALQISQALALESDKNFKAFKQVFSRAHEKQYLDMTLQHSYEIAQEMSLTYDGDIEKGLDDFEEITEFCTQEEIHPSKPRCAFLGTAIAKLGEDFEEPIAPVFMKTFEFLHEDHEVHVAESLIIAHDVASISPHAFKNFKRAYEYGIGKDGLDLQARQSLQFAMEMVQRTVEGKGEKKFERLPANIEKTPLPPLHDVKVKKDSSEGSD